MRSIDSVAQALGQTVRYGACDQRERQAISRTSTRVDVPAGAVLAAQGARGHDFAIVLSGTAAMATDGQVFAKLSAGDHFGDIAMIDGGPNAATVVATTPMALAVVGPAEFGALLECSPAVRRAVLSGLAVRVRTGDAA